jgi:hypothetical protein
MSTDLDERTLEITFESITPTLAAQYIATNDTNRYLGPVLVDSYARDMVEGRWQLTGQGIIFSMDGRLIDGQHRMAAVIQSGVTTRMMVVRGTRPSTMAVLDSGRKRTAADHLGLQGCPNRMVHASIARLTMLFDKEEIQNIRHRTCSNAEVLAFSDEHLVELKCAAERATHYRHMIPSTTSVLGTAYLLFRRSDVAACTEFFESISMMTLKGDGDPRLVLYRKLNVLKSDRTRATQTYQLDLFIRTWNAWRSDQRVVLPWVTRKVVLAKVAA